MRALLRSRDFVLLWVGQSVSELGSAVGYVAFTLVAVIVLHASDVQVGIVAAAGPAAWLLIGLPAGAAVDRLPRRLVLVGADLGRAALLAAVPVAWSIHLLTLWLLSVAASGTLANLVIGGFNTVIVLFLARQLAFTPGLIGVLFSIAGVGGVFGALVAAPLASRIGDARVMWGSLLVSAAGGLLVPLTAAGAGLAWYAAGVLPLIAGIAACNVCVRAALQVASPEHLRGRVTATIRLFSRGATPLGAVAGGALAAALTPRVALAILMGFLVLAPVWLLLSPVGHVRDLAQLAPTPATPGPPDR